MNKINIQYHRSIVGQLIIGSYSHKLCLLDFRYRKKRTAIDNRLKKKLNAKFVQQSDEIIETAIKQLKEYLRGKRTKFDIPIIAIGTGFQRRVWNTLKQIPYGETASYLQIAKKINKPKAVRAVANANGANAISIIIPCHRIIGNNGKLVGYGGGLAVKKKLLELEKKFKPV